VKPIPFVTVSLKLLGLYVLGLVACYSHVPVSEETSQGSLSFW